jgi:exopolyphosphatase / guanosine-5'-triphosphate,3'-diphosphate pyrophosphatase
VHTFSKPLAALDVGSNTIHLTVARIVQDGTELDYIADELDLVRLGADVSATGRIGRGRMQRAIAAIKSQIAAARAHHADIILGIATESVRTAANGQELIRRAEAETGLRIETITGEQEAVLTYWGGTSGLRTMDQRRAVIDLGGGSLEIVIGANTRIDWRMSLPLGAGSLHDQHKSLDPLTEQALATIEWTVHEAFAPLEPPLPVKEVVVCGGTATTLATLSGLVLQDAHPTAHPRDSFTSNGTRRIRYLTRERMAWLQALIRAQPSTELARCYGIDLGRAQLLGAGTAILIATMEELGADTLRIRKRGLREGALLAYAQLGEEWLDYALRGQGW